MIVYVCFNHVQVPTVPTVSSTRARGRVPAAAESSTAQPASSSKPDSFFDPNILIAQVQATKADHLDLPDHHHHPQQTKLGKDAKDVIDDSEESNIIPFADVPSDDGVPSEQVFEDTDITLINLQRDKAKQNFKGFVDTDLIDDNLRTTPEDDAGFPVFIPTRPPPPRRVSPARSTTSSTTRGVTTPKSTTRQVNDLKM